jgi:hypothetical protein
VHIKSLLKNIDSHYYIRKNVLKQTDDDIMQIDQQIAMENQSQDPRWVNPTILSNEQMVMQTQAMMQQPVQPAADLSPRTQGSPGPSEEAKKMEDVRKGTNHC